MQPQVVAWEVQAGQLGKKLGSEGRAVLDRAPALLWYPHPYRLRIQVDKFALI